MAREKFSPPFVHGTSCAMVLTIRQVLIPTITTDGLPFVQDRDSLVNNLRLQTDQHNGDRDPALPEIIQPGKKL